MALTRDWEMRITRWLEVMPDLFYQALDSVSLEGYLTHEQLMAEDAATRQFTPMPTGTDWGSKWQYGWFRGTVQLPKAAKGERIVFRSGAGSECAIYVNFKASGAWDKEHKEITLTRRGKPGTSYDILIEAYAGHGDRIVHGGPVPYGVETVPEPPDTQVTITSTTFGIWREDIYQLWMDCQTLLGVRESVSEDSLRLQEINRALKEMTLVVDLELPMNELLKTVAEGRKVLKPVLECKNGSTAPMVYCFGHSHIDVAHIWTLRETESKCVRTFGTQLAMMDEYKAMTFLQSQPHLYDVVKRKYPKLYARIKRAARSGRWIPEGAMWVESDTNLPSGESLIRQFIHGKRFFNDEFGVDSKMLWLPDVFGYSGALPQIMQGCGVTYFSTMKLNWAIGRIEPFPYHNFWWQGIDGTRVFAHIHQDYASETKPASLTKLWDKRRQREGLVSRILPYGWGDGGGGPTRDHLEYLEREEDLEGLPKTKHCHPLDFFRDEEARGLDWMPSYVGELYFQNHRGTFTTEAKTKKGNRLSEFSLRDAEMWCVAAQSLAGLAYPLGVFDGLWKKVLVNQFHDIIPGSSIEKVFEEAEADYAEVVAESRQLVESAADSLLKASKAKTTVFNSLSWGRNALVPLPKGFKGAEIDGQPLPSQVIDGTTCVHVSAIPSCGWLTLDKGKPCQPESSLNVTRTLIENEYLKVTLNNRGELTSIYDKEHKRELAAGPCNQFRLFKDIPFNFDAWNIDAMYRDCPVPLDAKAKVTVKDKGSLVASVVVSMPLNDSTLEQEIRLTAGSRQLDFITTIDWQEKHKLLKVAFPVEVYAKDSLHEIQFGHLARPTHESNNIDATQFEVCQHRWTALAENSHGVALLNDCKYGIDVLGNVMSLTLLKSPLAPNMRADRGTQTFTYSFLAWDGPFADSDVVRKGYELNVQPTVVKGDGGRGNLFNVDQDNIIIETVKSAEDGSGDIIVRLYEAMNMHCRCTLTTELPIAGARITNMLEEGKKRLACRGGKMQLEFRPFEIKTLRLTGIN